ncbi:MAG: hypothetical protein ACRC11_09695 [Xenococcaceae cyanobacterium]
MSLAKKTKERTKITQVLDRIENDVNLQAIALYNAAKEKVNIIATAAKEFGLRSDRKTEQHLIEIADNASHRLEDIVRKISKLIDNNKGKNT